MGLFSENGTKMKQRIADILGVFTSTASFQISYAFFLFLGSLCLTVAAAVAVGLSVKFDKSSAVAPSHHSHIHTHILTHYETKNEAELPRTDVEGVESVDT